MRRTVKSTITAVVAGSLHSNKKSLSAELRRYQGFGVDVTLLNLGFDVTDFNSLPLITNDLMEWANRDAMRAVQASQSCAVSPLDCGVSLVVIHKTHQTNTLTQKFMPQVLYGKSKMSQSVTEGDHLALSRAA